MSCIARERECINIARICGGAQCKRKRGDAWCVKRTHAERRKRVKMVELGMYDGSGIVLLTWVSAFQTDTPSYRRVVYYA